MCLKIHRIGQKHHLRNQVMTLFPSHQCKRIICIMQRIQIKRDITCVQYKIYEQSSINRLQKEAPTLHILDLMKIESSLATLLPKDLKLVPNKVINKLQKGSVLVRKKKKII